MAKHPHTTALVECLDRGVSIAREYPHARVEPVHVLKSMLVPEEGIATRCTELAGLNLHEVRAKLDAALDDLPVAPHSNEPPAPSGVLKAALQQADIECQTLDDKKLDESHVLLAMISAHGGLSKELRRDLGYRRAGLLDAIKRLRTAMAIGEGVSPASGGGAGIKATGPLEFCEDLTARAARGELDPVVGRGPEIARLAEILVRRRKNNAIIVGEPGTGKTALVEGLAQRIHAGEVPPDLQGVHLFSLDLAGMVAGAKYKGEFEERFKKLLGELSRRPDAVLFVDEIHTLLGVGKGGGGIDAANMLKPALARGEIRLIGATTVDEYRLHIEKDPAFARRFVSVWVEEPDDPTTKLILEGVGKVYSEHHKVELRPEALDAAIHLSRRYLTNRFLPDKAVDLLDEASADVRILAQVCQRYLEAKGADKDAARRDLADALSVRRLPAPEEGRWDEIADRHARKVVDGDAIARRVALATKIPVHRMTMSERQRLRHLEDHLHERIIGQEGAIGAVANAIRRARTGLKQRPNQPNGSFLFLGPTGTGKTELAKALAAFLFGDEGALIRIDMTEYQSDYSVKRLIGADPGLVGYEEGGALTEALKRRPYSVVLFDEIDKAHHRCLDILIPMLDDGRLTDGKSNTIDCSNTVVILTSNYAGPWIASQIREHGQVDREQLHRRLLQPGPDQRPGEVGFRPELINRFDDFQVFHPLTEEQVRQIVDLQVSGLVKTLAGQEIELEVETSGRDLISKKGYDPEMGARPIRRTIDRLIGDPMALKLSELESPRGCRVRVRASGDAMDIHVETGSAARAATAGAVAPSSPGPGG